MQFTEKHARNQYGINADVSELLLEHQQSHAQVTLVKGKVATSPQSVATFVYTWGGRREFEVRKDQEFSLKPNEQIKYKLVDVQPDKAVIVNTQQPNAPIEIGFAAPCFRAANWGSKAAPSHLTPTPKAFARPRPP